MPEQDSTPSSNGAPLLSDLMEQQATTRRAFLGKSALSLVVGGATLAACRQETPQTARGHDTARGQDTGRGMSVPNPNSRLDTALHTQHTPTSAAAGGLRAADLKLARFDPTLPPLSSSRTLKLHFRAMEVPLRISDSTVIHAWTFEGNVPGPIVHCRVGDTVEFTLTNEGVVPHSMDFHAAQVDPKTAFRSIVKGQSVTFTFKPKWAGAFMYHCGSSPVLMHIGSGMFGAIIVSPQSPLPPAKEFVLIESELYLAAPDAGGISAFDYGRMLSTLPDQLAFNGRPLQYMTDPIRVKVGDRVRFYVVNAGPTHACAFHVVGEQFDTVYLGAPPNSPIRGVQTFAVPAGGGMIFELLCDVAGEFPFVNHGFGHGQKGAIGLLVVE